MKKTVIIFWVVITSASCNKKQETHTLITGKVTELNTDKPVAGALVKLVSLTHYTYNTVETIEDSVRTDEQGNYRIETDVHTENDLMLYGTDADAYYPQDETDLLKKNVTRGKSQTLDFSLVPYGWVRINAIKDQGNDVLDINRLNGSSQSFIIWTDTVVTSQAHGNTQISIHCFYRKDGLGSGKQTYEIYTVGHDTVDIDIHF